MHIKYDVPLLLLALILPCAKCLALDGIDSSKLAVAEMSCEYATNPLGVEAPKPRFSWLLQSDKRGQMQSACQILVASTQEELAADVGDKWDSGTVVSEQSVNVAYGGSPLANGERCYWKVRCWDRNERVGPWSQPAWFEMGLLKQSEWKGKWIGMETKDSPYEPGRAPAPMLRQKFQIAKPIKRARAYVSGIGWSELYINGRKIGDRVLDPAITDYAERVLYVVHDVTDQLVQGENIVGAMLGNGWYSNNMHFTQYGKWGDSPRLLLQLNMEFDDGSTMSIASDESWKVSTGPILRNDIYGGEIYDARLEKPGWATAAYDDSQWDRAAIKDPPGGKLQSQLMPAIKEIKVMKPVKLTNPKPGVYVYDLGQVFAGWARLRVKGPSGTKITIRYSERILADSGLIDDKIFCYPGLQSTDEYTLKGDSHGETYAPTFAFHPVRYVQIEGYPGTPTLDDLDGIVVHGAEDLAGDFHCSNELFNQIHRNTVWTLRNSLYGMPMDCIHREPIAYIDASEVFGNLNARKYMPLFWTKWLRDVADSQDEKGSISAIVPRYSIHVFDSYYGGTYPVFAWYLRQCYDDDRILKEHYAGMKKCVDYIASLAPNHILSVGTYGDHMVPGKVPGQEEYLSKESLPPLIWTAYHYLEVAVMAQIAGDLGKTEDAQHYAKLAEEIKEAFNKKWLDRTLNQYATGTQTCNLVALAVGLVPEANRDGVVKNVVRDIIEKYDGNFHCGETGAYCMMDTLPEYGQGEVLYNVLNKTTYPGWGYMVKEGATTLWEAWGRSWPGEPRERHESMIMLSFIEKFFYQDLAGIQGPAYHATRRSMLPGYRQIIIQPCVLGDLNSAGASIKTVRGMISSSWKKNGDSIILDVTIPVNSEANVSVPKLGLQDVIVTEGNKVAWQNGSYVAGAKGITAGSESADYVTLNLGSGKYQFRLTGTGKSDAVTSTLRSALPVVH